MRTEITPHTFQGNNLVIGEKRLPYTKGRFLQWKTAYLTADRKIVVLNLFQRIYRSLGGCKDTRRKKVWAALGSTTSCPRKKDFRTRIKEVIIQSLQERPARTPSQESIPLPQENTPSLPGNGSKNTDSSESKKQISDVEFQEIMEILETKKDNDTRFPAMLRIFSYKTVQNALSSDQQKKLDKLQLFESKKDCDDFIAFCEKEIQEKSNAIALFFLVCTEKSFSEDEMRYVYKAIDHADEQVLQKIVDWKVFFSARLTDENILKKAIEVANKKNFRFGTVVQEIVGVQDGKKLDNSVIEEGLQYLDTIYQKEKEFPLSYSVQKFLSAAKAQPSYDTVIETAFSYFKNMLSNSEYKKDRFCNLCILCTIQERNGKDYNDIWSTIKEELLYWENDSSLYKDIHIARVILPLLKEINQPIRPDSSASKDILYYLVKFRLTQRNFPHEFDDSVRFAYRSTTLGSYLSELRTEFSGQEYKESLEDIRNRP